MFLGRRTFPIRSRFERTSLWNMSPQQQEFGSDNSVSKSSGSSGITYDFDPDLNVSKRMSREEDSYNFLKETAKCKGTFFFL